MHSKQLTRRLSFTALFSAILALGGILCFLFPSYFTLPSLRGLYPIELIRGLIFGLLALSFSLGVYVLFFGQKRVMAGVALGLVLVSVLLGGAEVEIGAEDRSFSFVGLDWFFLNILFFSMIFVPLEKLFPKVQNRSFFRDEWRVDFTYFLVSMLAVQLVSFLMVKPTIYFLSSFKESFVTLSLNTWPLSIQFILILLIADFAQYWVHRLFHRIPLLWRFHEIHHSAKNMDWLAGSRLHLVDVIVTRSLCFAPIYLLGFSESAIICYIAFVSFHATFIHSNLNWNFDWTRDAVATPRFHHWHHTSDPNLIDKNFAVHLPLIDKLFGTYWNPRGEWPKGYGLADGKKLSPWFTLQFIEPFRMLYASRSNTSVSSPRKIPRPRT